LGNCDNLALSGFYCYYNDKDSKIINNLIINRTAYYIPFSKKNVDEIIEISAHTDKYEIRYTVKWGHEDSTDFMVQSMRNQFSYDMFLWEWEKLTEFQYWPVDNIINRPKANANKKSATNLEFKPS